MIKIDENDPVGEVDPSFPFRDVKIKKNTDMKQFYELQKEIGRGKFGTVYRCTEKSTGLKLAAKFINTSKRQDRRNAEREVEIMRELQHPRLIQIYDAYEIHNTMCVILELIEGGELFERVIDDDFVLTEKSVSVFMKQICEGVAFIHSKNILHLDMKPENILCLSRNGNRIKIIDFGLARKYDPEKKMQVLFGTPEFVAPEVVNFDSIGFGTDMWSVGVICYVLLSGLSPFMGETDVQTMANVTIAQYDFEDESFNDISKDAKDFISRLLVKDREVRMSASECLNHEWLRRRNCAQIHDSDLVTQEQIDANEDDSKDKRGNELEYQKDTLRNIVDRWNEDAHVISAIANGESDDLEPSLEGKISKSTDTNNAVNPGDKTNQLGLKPKTKIVKTKKPKKDDKDTSVATSKKKTLSNRRVGDSLEKVTQVEELPKCALSEEKLVNGVISDKPTEPVPAPNTAVERPDPTEKPKDMSPAVAKKKMLSNRCIGDCIEKVKQVEELPTCASSEEKLVNGIISDKPTEPVPAPSTEVETPDVPVKVRKKIITTAAEGSHQKDKESPKVKHVIKDDLSVDLSTKSSKDRKSPMRKTSSPSVKKKKVTKVTSESVDAPPPSSETQPNKLVANIAETVKSIFTRSSSKDSSSKSTPTVDDCHPTIEVEVNDESYKRVKKCTFIIKNITENEGADGNHKDADTCNRNSSSASDEEMERLSNVALRRRISDITSLLSQGDHMNRSADEIATLSNNLNKLLRTRHDSISKSSSCGESGSFASKRPKFRISCFSRDVPIANAMSNPPINLASFVNLPFGDEDARLVAPWSFRGTNHSDPGSLRTSPERFGPPSLTRKILSRFFSDSMEYDLSGVPSSSPNSMTKDKLTELIS